ncbi:MAG: disulfide bond formation protein B [Rhodoferax sp.]|uniref:disulfide bond formation protein B n=1 Tax=Rhodoferax sp. TaxID=50421 RepID=UPI00272F1769|nr:disulfide bond formation protein B [Rhodoferax sp.]MDP1529135.1 disulfide bond formation protein B [Rhodoferax sp.]MDP1945473.1 disulfide bond formation protein B [Rhodoferax sp.]
MSWSSKTTAWTLVFAAWLVAASATLGALFMSEVMGFAPCVLCWWQRIFMFPLVLILALGLFPFDRTVLRYALPLAVGGLLVAGFHVLLTMGIIPETLAPCREGIPCKTLQVAWFGFVTIPLLSFFAFLVITLLLVAAHLKTSK